MMSVKVTSKRQVTFPKHVLETLGVGPGDRIEIEEREDHFILRPKREVTEWVPPLRGKIPPGTPPFDIHKFREERCAPAPRD